MQAGADSLHTDMSASPKLRTKKKAQPIKKKMLGVRKTTSEVMVFVGVMAKTIEEQQTGTSQPSVAAAKTELNKHNRVFRLIQGGNAHPVAQLNQEMALQADCGAQQMAPSPDSHLTGRTGAQPTREKIELCEQESMENGHFDGANLARDNVESRE